jgi:GAF domain-containing protein
MRDSQKVMPKSEARFITDDKMVINILITTVAGLVLISIAVGASGDTPTITWILSISAVFVLAGIYMAFRGMTLPGRILVPVILTVAVAYIASNRGGLYHISMLGLPVIIVLAGLLLGIRGVFIFATFTSLVSVFIGYADINGFLPFSESSRAGYDDIAVAITLLFTTAIVLRLVIKRLSESIQQAEAYGTAQEKTNAELKKLQHDLEQRVQERTAELGNRASQLEAISIVARSIASLQDLEQLLPAITNLVSDRFGFYHVGIFLLDDANEYAVLRAANSDGGSRMLARQHKLKLESTSIVGLVTSRNEARVALDVGKDSVYFNNPDLPETRSEMALPLRISERVIGALDVQSKQPNAFSKADIASLTILADQVAIAIENARLFSASTAALSESEQTFERYVKQEWSTFAAQAKSTGYVFDGNRTMLVKPKGQPQEKIKALAQTGRLSLQKESSEIAVPIRLRGQTIGYLEVNSKKGNRQWTRDEITLLESAAERAALALENARLVETAQRRASRERAIGEISSRIGAVTDVEAIMQMAVEELGRKISGVMEVTIELGDGYEQVNS